MRASVVLMSPILLRLVVRDEVERGADQGRIFCASSIGRSCVDRKIRRSAGPAFAIAVTNPATPRERLSHADILGTHRRFRHRLRIARNFEHPGG